MKPASTPFAILQALFLCATFALSSIAGAADNPIGDGTVQQQVDINSADAATLAEALDGVGLVKAQAIIEYRQQFGKFQSLEQLLEVNGIGAATLEKNRHRLMVNTEPN
ncbi:MAG: ComEA family DNA-binding protein [Gammaproteobacteria bacterium]|jgi:competence protein ComEA